MTREQEQGLVSKRPGELLGEIVMSEQASMLVAESLMRNYNRPETAMFELIDNCVDNRLPGKPLTIRVQLGKEAGHRRIFIRNDGGMGLNEQGLRNFFVWGYSNKDDVKIGQYGVGGKSAIGYLGNSVFITCSPSGSWFEYEFTDGNWRNKGNVASIEHQVKIRRAEKLEGYFSVRITQLEKRPLDARVLMAQLANYYRPILQNGEVKIVFHGINKDGQPEELKPLEIKYIEDDHRLEPTGFKKVEGKVVPIIYETACADQIRMKIGVLAEGQKVKSGLRLYYRGRLMREGEYFHFPTAIPQAARLIGEVYLDSLKVTSNKSDFDEGTDQWREAVKTIERQLMPWADKLQFIPMEQKHEVTAREKNLIQETKRDLEHILSQMPVGQVITREQLPGTAFGKWPPTPQEEPRPEPKRPRVPGPIEGATFPDHKATRGPFVKRRGFFDAWIGESFVDSDKDKQWKVTTSEDGKKIFKINIDFPLYQAFKERSGVDALPFYVSELAIAEYCQRHLAEGGTIEEYLQLKQELSRRFGELSQQRPLRYKLHHP